MKQKVLDTEDIFFLNLDEDLKFYAKASGFDFEMEPLSLYEEASMSMYVMHIAQELLENPEYSPLIDSLEYPDLKEDGEVEFRPIDTKKLSDLKYVISYLPSSFASLVDNVAFFNKVVKNITKNGQKIAIRNPNNAEKPIMINTFLDFVKYVKGKNIHLLKILEDLFNQYSEWENATSIDPSEVKN